MMTSTSTQKLVAGLVCFSVAGAFTSQTIAGGVLELNGSAASGHYTRGIQLSDNGPVVEIGIDWSSNNGSFVGANCFRGSSERLIGFRRGCVLTAGYFGTLNANNALSVEFSRADYPDNGRADWDTNVIALNWHYKDSLFASVSYSDDWYARGTDTAMLDMEYRYSLAEGLTAKASIGYLEPFDDRFRAFTNLGIGLEYQVGRWVSSVSATQVDSSLRDVLPFGFDRPEWQWRLAYQLY